MLLRRLVEYAGCDDAAPAFHRDRRFDFELALDTDGRPSASTVQPLTAADEKGRVRGVIHTVPTMGRTVGVAANLTADDAQYVLGWGDDTTKPARVQRCHAAFVDLTCRWARSPAGQRDPVAQAVAAFYRDGHANALRRPEGCRAKSGVLVVVDGVPAYRAVSVPVFWAEEVARSKGSSAGAGLCLSCGQTRGLLNTLPGKVPATLVPGATNDAALVSVNERVFGYDLTIQLAASPICVSCGEAVTAGLVRALGSPHSARFPRQNTRMAWWTTAQASFDPVALLDEPGDEINWLLQSVHRGDPLVGDEAVAFCSLSVGGNVARVVVRDWLEMPIAQVREHVAAWFDDHAIDPVRRNGSPHHGIGRLALVCGRWVRGARATGQGSDHHRGHYADFGAKAADRPDGVHADLVRAALRKTPLPHSLHAHLVHRIRADGHLDDSRAALLRLILTRHRNAKEKPMPGLDPDSTTPAYVAGRAFAVLENIQFDTSDERRNTTYGDRYFAGAISNPLAALVAGRRDASAWLRKLRRDPKKQGLLVRHEQQLDQLFNLLGLEAGIPSRTSLREQSLFLLGYHHQRAHRFAAIAKAKAARDTTTISTDAEETQP